MPSLWLARNRELEKPRTARRTLGWIPTFSSSRVLEFSSFRVLSPPYPQRIRHAVDVIEPRRDQGDLEDRLVVETVSAQRVQILGTQHRRIERQLLGVLQHRAIGV